MCVRLEAELVHLIKYHRDSSSIFHTCSCAALPCVECESDGTHRPIVGSHSTVRHAQSMPPTLGQFGPPLDWDASLSLACILCPYIVDLLGYALPQHERLSARYSFIIQHLHHARLLDLFRVRAVHKFHEKPTKACAGHHLYPIFFPYMRVDKAQSQMVDASHRHGMAFLRVRHRVPLTLPNRVRAHQLLCHGSGTRSR